MQAERSALVVAAIGAAAIFIYLSPWLWRRFQVYRLRQKVSTSRLLALTYDDGPSPELTPQLLDLLKQRGARATFFMLGRHAQQYPDLVDRVVREGHHIGCHSHRHINAWKSPPWKAIKDIDAGYKFLSRWISSSTMFRPPHGKLTLFTFLSIRRRHAPIAWWTIDSGDTHRTMPSITEVARRVHAHGGGIVLMHDLDRTQARNRFVLELTASLLDVAECDGIQIIPLQELYQ